MFIAFIGLQNAGIIVNNDATLISLGNITSGSALLKTYDTWQEGFLAIFHLLKKDEPFVVNIYHNAPRGYIYRYLYKVTYQLIYNVLEEKAADMVVREEDKAFIADFYKYGFVGLVLEWIDKGMKEDPKQIIERLNALIQGSFAHALNNAKLNRS